MGGLRTLVAAALAATFLFLGACSDNSAERGPRKRLAPVTVGKAEVMSVPVQIRTVGNIEAYQTAAVRAQVGGLIVEQRVRDGQAVAAGDVLFILDQRPYTAALKDAQGRLERDTALLKKAEDDLVRYTGLKQKDVVSQQQYDQANTDAKSLRASIKLSEAQIEQAKLQLEYATITAPFAGRVGSVLVNVGNVIKANDDRSLLVVNQVEPIYAVFSVPEQHLPAITARLGRQPLPVDAYLAGDDASPERGQLNSVENAVDRTTGTIRLKAIFDNKSNRLWPGQFVRCVLTMDQRDNVVTVPATAVQIGPQGPYVYVVKPDNTAEFRPVVTQETFEGKAIIAKGLSGGETVVTDGHIRLAPGMAMEIKKPGGAAAGAGSQAQ